MADHQKKQQEYPFAPANRYPRSDVESNTLNSNELKRKKRIKWAMYVTAFIVFQAIQITVFSLTVMRVKTPKLRLGDNVQFQTLATGNQSSPAFDMSFTAQVKVKNTNWGPYKFVGTTATFEYDGVTVGQVLIPKGKASLKSTKKIGVVVNLSSSALQTNSTATTKLGNELSGGALTLTSRAQMTGKVELMLVMKKKKSAQMDCIIAVDVSAKAVRSLQCK